MKFQNQSGDFHLFKSIGEVSSEDVGEDCVLDCLNGVHCETSISNIEKAIERAEQYNQGYF
ncbi:MAG: hypothetical protein KAS32_05250 [Candidatus Peribacteraceae bacterium]|nr:hypothetical protein [Candidatus Peribacteraceae bacterium]